MLNNIIAPHQTVEVDFGGYRTAPGRFCSGLQVLEDDQASGQASLEIEESYENGGTGVLIYLTV